MGVFLRLRDAKAQAEWLHEMCIRDRPHAAHFQADDAGADHAQRLRHGADVQRAVVGQHDLFIERQAGQLARRRTGGDHHVLGNQVFLGGAGDLDGPAALDLADERALAMEEGDLVLLEQVQDAVVVPVSYTHLSFRPVIGEVDEAIDAAKVKRVLACSGKVYYDLVNARRERGVDNVAIVRVAQLYPFAHKSFETELRKYPKATEVIWVQDEPQNQGAWFYVQHHVYENMVEGQKLGYAGRAASASPAVGYLAKHQEQQKALIETAFAPKFKVMLTK